VGPDRAVTSSATESQLVAPLPELARHPSASLA
jgi:hypothetical protein